MTQPAPGDLEHDVELARRIACAAISFQMGISYQTYWNNYIKPKDAPWPLGTVWIDFAKMVTERVFKHKEIVTIELDERLHRLLKTAQDVPAEDIEAAIQFLQQRTR